MRSITKSDPAIEIEPTTYCNISPKKIYVRVEFNLTLQLQFKLYHYNYRQSEPRCSFATSPC